MSKWNATCAPKRSPVVRPLRLFVCSPGAGPMRAHLRINQVSSLDPLISGGTVRKRLLLLTIEVPCLGKFASADTFITSGSHASGFTTDAIDSLRNAAISGGTVKKKLLLLTLSVLCIATVASADTFVTFPDRATQNPTDIIDWGQLGPDSTSVNSPGSVTSFNGLGATVSIPGPFMVTCQDLFGCWNGNFEPGENLLYTGNQLSGGPGPLTIAFASGVSSVGFQIQDAFFAPFTATLQAFN